MINIYYLIAMVGNRVISFLTLLVLAYVLTPDDFGIYSLAFSNALVLQVIFSTWLSTGGGRYVSIADEGDNRALSTMAASTLALIAFFAAVALVHSLMPFTTFSRRIVVIVLGWTTAFLIYDMTSSVQAARQQVKAFTQLSLVRNTAASGLSLLGGYFADAEGAMIGQVLGAYIGVVFLPRARGAWGPARLAAASRPMLGAMFRFGSVGIFNTGLYMMTALAVRNPVGIRLGEAEAGLAALATDLFFIPVAVILNAFGLTQAVSLNRSGEADAGSESRRAHLEKLLDQTFLVILPYIAGGALLAAPLVDFLLPGDLGVRLFAIATPAALFGACLIAFYGMTGALLTFKHHRALTALTITTVLAILADSWFLAPYGLTTVLWVAAAIAGAAALIAYLILAIAGGARLLTPARVRVGAATALMAAAIVTYRQLNDIEPLSALLLGVGIYVLAVVKLGVIGWRELLRQKLPEPQFDGS